MPYIDHLPENIKSVILRLKFVDTLYAKRVNYQGEHNYNTEFDFHPYSHFFALINYLLLTCLDVLSEQEKFTDYGSWIRANKNDVRDSVLAKCQEDGLTHLESSRLLYEKYKEKFGLNKSIKHLVFENFSSNNREKLFDSIKVYKKCINNNGDIVSQEEILAHEEKFKYLLNIRNKYTHEAFLYTGIDDMGLFFNDNFSLKAGKVLGACANQTRVEESNSSFKIVSLLGWPIVIREILADYIFERFQLDARLVCEKIQEYRGEYNFELLWCQSEKILLTNREDNKLIYLGGSVFKNAEEARNYMNDIVSDAIQEDNPSKYGRLIAEESVPNNKSYAFSVKRPWLFGSIVNVVGQVVSKKGNNYPIRFKKQFNQYLFWDKNISNWRVQFTKKTEVPEVIEEARKYINDVFEKGFRTSSILDKETH
ncbi:MAG: hypothetical protein GZ091_07175 [Paludibacter sp.]|nr:hypothetical protein [Paludibacter sp.]